MSIPSHHPALSLAVVQRHRGITMSPRWQLIALVFVFSRQTREPRHRQHVRHRGTVSRAQPSGTNIYAQRGLLCHLCSLLFPGISWRVSDGNSVSYMATCLCSRSQSWKGTGRELPPVARILYGIFAETPGWIDVWVMLSNGWMVGNGWWMMLNNE